MAVRSLFATLVDVGRLAGAGSQLLNRRLLLEARQLRVDDAAGRSWSRAHYPSGYTSYCSVNRLHEISPTFAELARRLQPAVRRFAAALQLDLKGRRLQMTDCWVNVMGSGAVHGLHLHPAATISGTYYLLVPPGSAGLKLEDPRLDRFMAAPPRAARGRSESWVTVPARTGSVVLFESWLRHEVPMQRVRGERISVSFNYGWF